LGAKLVEAKDPKKELLSMIMIDLNYNEKYFSLDQYYFADEINKKNFKIDLGGNIGNKIMVIYLDVFGNEKKEILTKKDFKGR